MERITEKNLQYLVDRINQIKGYELTPYQAEEPYNPNANVYHLDHAYGGVCLIQMMDKGSGIRSVIPGFGTKRDLYNKMQAMLTGMEAMSL